MAGVERETARTKRNGSRERQEKETGRGPRAEDQEGHLKLMLVAIWHQSLEFTATPSRRGHIFSLVSITHESADGILHYYCNY